MMKRGKLYGILAAVLAGTMLLAACDAAGVASTATAPAEAVEETAEAVEETAEAVEEAAEETAEAVEEAAEETAEAAAEEVWEGDIDEIKILLIDERGNSQSIGSIADAMNEITEKTIGVKADIQVASFGDYNTQLSLMLSAGEGLDICSLAFGPTGFTSLVANGQVMDITDLMDEYAPETVEMMGDYLNAYTVNGRQYALPPYRNYASANYLIMRKDLLEDIGYTEEQARAIHTWSELEDVYVKMAEAHPELAPTAGVSGATVLYTGEEFSDYEAFDSLGDGFGAVYTDTEGNVSWLPENEDYVTTENLWRKWYDNKWMYQDMIITDDPSTEIMKAGGTFSFITISEMGVETSKKEATGYEVIAVETSNNKISSQFVGKFGLAVPITAEEPEAAVRWLNALYTDARLTNLLDWGIEGRDYVLLESGEAAFPEGVTSQNVEYHETDFFNGNYFLAHPWEGNGGNFRQEAYDYLMAAEISPFLGFQADQSEIPNLMTQLSAVYEKWSKRIGCGGFNDEEFEAYKSEQKAAGVDDYLAAYQTQLDAWKAAMAENE